MSHIYEQLIEKVNDIIVSANELKVEILKAQTGGSSNPAPNLITAPAPAPAPVPVPAPAQNNPEYESEFQALHNAVLSQRWPEAAKSSFICDPDNVEDRMMRGRGIIEVMIEDSLAGLKFLDFGCGDGSIVMSATNYDPEIAVGYDIVNSVIWNDSKHPKAKLTTNFNTVVENGPYDIILLYDVMDHLVGESPQNVLLKIKTLLKDNGKIYMRCHPFTSKHATHLYHDLNKAYLHLVFTPEELKKIIPEPKHHVHNNGVIYPIKTYGDIIANAGLKVLNRNEKKEEVDSFFKIPRIAERIMRITKTTSFPEFQMSLQFIDYILTK